MGVDIARNTLRAHPAGRCWSVINVRNSPARSNSASCSACTAVRLPGQRGVGRCGGSPPVPERFKLASVTRARDLIDAGERLSSSDGLRCVIELPTELDAVPIDERKAVEQFLAWARSRGAHEDYVARHRRAWWSVGLREPAPILCTYMGRRPPQFTLNACDARHINIATASTPARR